MAICHRTDRTGLVFTPDGASIVSSIDFSPDGKRIAILYEENGPVRIWDANQGKLMQELPGGTRGKAIFSPDGKQLLTNFGTSGSLYDLQTGRPVFSLASHTGEPLNLDFSPDGRYLGVGYSDRWAKVWDASTGQELFTFPGSAITFTPDGKHLITEDVCPEIPDTTKIRGFFLDINDLMPLARTRLVRTWTQEECQQYLHLQTCPPAP